MKSFKSLVLAFLFTLVVAGSAFAVSFTHSINPETGGPELTIMSVYNNSSSTMDVGDVAIWDGDASTGDDDNWVNTTTTADTYIVAGVVYPADILAGGVGTIVIRGPVQTDFIAGGNSVDGPACSSATAGAARSCNTDAANFGFVTQAGTGTSAVVCVHCNK